MSIACQTWFRIWNSFLTCCVDLQETGIRDSVCTPQSALLTALSLLKARLGYWREIFWNRAFHRTTSFLFHGRSSRNIAKLPLLEMARSCVIFSSMNFEKLNQQHYPKWINFIKVIPNWYFVFIFAWFVRNYFPKKKGNNNNGEERCYDLMLSCFLTTRRVS